MALLTECIGRPVARPRSNWRWTGFTGASELDRLAFMTWADLWTELSDQEALFEHTGDLATLRAGSSLADDFLKIEDRETGPIERAIVEYGSTQKWPALTPRQKILVRLRVEFALSILDCLRHSKLFPNPTPERERLIQLCLIQWWDEAGLARTHGMIPDILGERPAGRFDNN